MDFIYGITIGLFAGILFGFYLTSLFFFVNSRDGSNKENE